MSLWSESEFQRVALGTRLTDSSVNACREVLVFGVPTGVAARNFKMFASQVSRSLGILRDHQTEMVKEAQGQLENGVVLKQAAESVARSLLGDGSLVFDPSAGQNYEGSVLAVQHGYVIQKMGRFAALHDLGKFAEPPRIGAMLSISYPRDGGQPVVTEMRGLGRDAGPTVGR